LTTLKKEVAGLEDGEEKTFKEEQIRLWNGRLQDLGIRVASALVEMEDYDGAAYFLSTLKPVGEGDDKLALQKALLYLTIGQVDEARSCISTSSGDDDGAKTILALAHMADGDYDAAVTTWEALIDTSDEKNNALYMQNLAVALLYEGKMSDVSSRSHLSTLC
jgi:tetratricopeptide (TPR) repeat protein